MKCHRYLPLLLGASLFCAAPSFAQPKKTSSAVPAQPANQMPLLIGAGIGGLILGGLLGFALKKAPPAPVVKEDDGPGPMFEDSPIPLAVVNSGEKIDRANAAFNRFFNIQTAANSSFPDLIHPDDLARTRAPFHEVIGGDLAHFSKDTRFFRPDGTLLYTTLDVRKLGKARKPKEILVTLQDTTVQVESQTELAGARDAIKALYEVISGDKSRDLDSKMRSLLSMGCGRFELPIGALGRVADGCFETLFVQSADRRVRPAMTIPRGDTSLEAKLLGVDTLPSSGNARKHPFVSRNEDIAYFGAPILVSGEFFGMLSFSSNQPREKPFGSEEAELLQLMAEWVGGEIERENNRLALETQKKALLEANDKLEQLATHDPLTEAKNRRAFNDKLTEEWSRAKRYGTPLSMILLDVDKFKSFNDTFGHPAGDEVLKRVARVCMAGVRGTDFFARYGGEEFVVLLPNTDADGAIILAERLRHKIESTPWKERDITASMGISSVSTALKNVSDLTQSADNALYASKEKGRNCVTHVRELAPPVVETEA